MVLQIAEVPSDPIQKGCRAFTLLELLMASAAFAMIVLVMKVTLMGSLPHDPLPYETPAAAISRVCSTAAATPTNTAAIAVIVVVAPQDY